MFLKNMPRGSRGQETGRRKMGGDYTVVSSVGCSFSLHKEILDLKAKLSAKESELLRLDCSSSNTILMPGGFNSGPDSCTNSCGGSSGGDQSLLIEAEEWQSKYERLVEAHKKLQRNNICLEEKLLKLVEKFDSEKNLMTRDLATQTQQVVEGKLTIQQLHKQNTQLKSDLQVALNLLQMKPSSFIAQKMDSLPEDLQLRVKQYATEKPGEKRNFRNGGQKITISVPNGGESVSAAILAKVLEERENERKKEQKFCIDIGTQTHGWQFPDVRELVSHDSSNKLLSMPPDYSLLQELGYLGSEKEIASARERILAEKAFFEETDYEESDDDEDEDAYNTEMGMQKTHVSNILLSSLIQPPPLNIVDQRPPSQSSSEIKSAENKKQPEDKLRSAHGTEEHDQSTRTELNHKNSRIYPADENMKYKTPNEDSVTSIKKTEFKPSSQHLANMTNISILSSTRTMFSPPQTPALSQQSSISSILSLTQQASTTPTLTSNAFFKRSFSNTSYSAYQTDM